MGEETFDDRGPAPLPGAPAAPARRPVRRALVVAVAAAAGLAWLVVPGRAPQRPPPAPPTAAPTSAAPDVFALATRGSLAADAAFLDGVRRQPWADPDAAGAAAPPVSARHVVFAGDVAGGRWALVVAARPTAGPYDRAAPLGGEWLTGPPGATPGRMTAQWIPHDLGAGLPVALVAARTGALVVVAAPGDVVTVSDRPDVAADGRVTRTYRTVAAPGGLAVTGTIPSPLPGSTATVVRVLRHGVALTGTATEYLADPTDPPPVAIDYLRGAPPRSGRQVAEATAQRLLNRLGLPPASVGVAALWVGFIPRPGGVSGAAALVAVTVPSGAVVVGADWLVLVTSADYYVHGRCGQGIDPAGPPVSRRVTALTCDFQSRGGTPTAGGSLVVVGPTDVVRFRTYTGGGTLLQEYPATGGTVVVPLPLGVDTVEGITRRGSSLGRVALLGSVPLLGD